eukprot:COSAG03_NODE_13426_length_503_cov_54.816832_1_plen_43_part_01
MGCMLAASLLASVVSVSDATLNVPTPGGGAGRGAKPQPHLIFV